MVLVRHACVAVDKCSVIAVTAAVAACASFVGNFCRSLPSRQRVAIVRCVLCWCMLLLVRDTVCGWLVIAVGALVPGLIVRVTCF